MSTLDKADQCYREISLYLYCLHGFASSVFSHIRPATRPSYCPVCIYVQYVPFALRKNIPETLDRAAVSSIQYVRMRNSSAAPQISLLGMALLYNSRLYQWEKKKGRPDDNHVHGSIYQFKTLLCPLPRTPRKRYFPPPTRH